jgi:hypothetical protein
MTDKANSNGAQAQWKSAQQAIKRASESPTTVFAYRDTFFGSKRQPRSQPHSLKH